MQRISPLQLLRSASPKDRILYHNLWLRRHGNVRSEELLPRFDRVDAYLIEISARRALAAVQWRLLSRLQRARHSLALGRGSRTYRWLFTTDMEQIPFFRGDGIVVDVDDPWFTEQEVHLLNRPNVRAFVVTVAEAGQRFVELGVRTPWHVVPQGVDLSALEPDAVEALARRRGTDGHVVIGFVASWLLTAGDRRGTNPIWNIDHLLELWEEIRAGVPDAQLWLIGSASRRIRSRCAGRSDIVLTGPLPRREVLTHVANFDIALYPRTRDTGIASIKVAEYMGAGVPTVSYDYKVTKVLRETGAGILVQSPREFVAAVGRLASNPAERASYGAAAGAAGAKLDWTALAKRYEEEVFDRYLAAG